MQEYESVILGRIVPLLGNQPEFTLLELIETLRPVIIKEGVWKEESVVGQDAVRSWDGKLVIIPETEGASTTNIAAKILEVDVRN